MGGGSALQKTSEVEKRGEVHVFNSVIGLVPSCRLPVPPFPSLDIAHPLALDRFLYAARCYTQIVPVNGSKEAHRHDKGKMRELSLPNP